MWFPVSIDDDDTLRMPLPELAEEAPPPGTATDHELTGVMPPNHDDEGQADDVSLHFGDTTGVVPIDEELPAAEQPVLPGSTRPGPGLDDETMELAPLEDGDVGDES